MADPRSASVLTATPAAGPTSEPGYGPSNRRPANPKLGSLYFDTTLNKEIAYTEKGWVIIGVQPAAMVGIGTTSQRPVNPPPGFIFYDLTAALQYTFTGSSWVSTSPAVSADSVGAGTTSQRPANPRYGFLYYDSTLQREIVWNGSSWTIIGPATITPDTGGAPVVTSPSSASGVVGVFFSYQITGTNTPTSYSTSATAALNAIGLTVNTTTGLISGTPTSTYASSLTLSATNGSGTGNLSFYLTIGTSGSGVPAITSATSAAGVVGTFFSYQIVATNFPSSYSTDSSVALAAIGLTLNTSTGLISGTPTGTFSATITVGATNSQGTGNQSVSLTITAAAVTSGRWTTSEARLIVFSNYPAFAGASVEDSTPSVLVFSATMANGQFPPGVTWQLVNPNGDIVASGTTEGGENIITSNNNIALGGGYVAIVSSTSSNLEMLLRFEISSGCKFQNSSARAFVGGPAIIGGVNGTTIQLTLSNISSSTQIASADFSQINEDGTVTVVNNQRFTVDFGGDTSNNPKTNFAAGLTSLVLIGRATNNFSADGIVQVYG